MLATLKNKKKIELLFRLGEKRALGFLNADAFLLQKMRGRLGLLWLLLKKVFLERLTGTK